MRIYWLWLASRPGMTEREKMAVFAHFGSPEDCYYADAYDGIENLSNNAVASLGDKDLKEAEAIFEALYLHHRYLHLLKPLP